MNTSLPTPEHQQEDVRTARQLLESGKFRPAAALCRGAVEGILRYAVCRYLGALPAEQRWKLVQLEQELGEGRKGVDQFELGRLLGLFEKADLWKGIETVEGRSTGALKRLDLNFLRAVGNDGAHSRSVSPTEAQFAVSAAETLASFFTASPGEVPAASKSHRSTLGTTIIEGTDHCVRFLTELARDPMLDRFDVSYVGRALRMTNDPNSSGYWKSLHERALDREIRVRRIVTLTNKEKTAWLLLKLIPGHEPVLGTCLRIAVFRTSTLTGQSDIVLPGIATIYSSKDPEVGFSLVDYQGDDDDQQQYVFLTGPDTQWTFRRAYAHWFRSADELTLDTASRLFSETFPEARSGDGLWSLVDQWSAPLRMSDEDKRCALSFWGRLTGGEPAAG